MTSYKGIYIIGQTERTGTNFLYNLLLQHPNIHRSDQPGEDRLLIDSSDLINYIDRSSAHWSESWKNMDIQNRKSVLKSELGAALKRFLGPDEKFILTKSPSVAGLENYHEFFTDYFPIILVRDGRNVVESLVSSFNKSYLDSMKEWASSVEVISAFIDKYPDTLVLKYEDLFEDPFAHIEEIINRINLDSTKVNREDLEAQAIVGSSQSSSKKGEVDWSKSIKRGEDFDPNKRFSNWNSWVKFRYRVICGRAAKKLNYDV